MLWPADHPASGDAALAPWLDGARELCAVGQLGPVLRHVPGRRIAIRVETPGGSAVLKVYANPRARGNHRRLEELARTTAAGVVPASLGTDGSGHVGLVAWTAGTPLDLVESEELVERCRQAGRALAILHASGAQLDREWTITNELTQLRRQATVEAAELVEHAAAVAATLTETPLVSAHRDLHPRQIVVGGAGVALIDLDDAAQAPAGLDVGNFVAHLRMDAANGHRPAPVVEDAVRAFVRAYGPVHDLPVWEWLALVRLGCLASARHRRAEGALNLLRMAAARSPVAA